MSSIWSMLRLYKGDEWLVVQSHRRQNVISPVGLGMKKDCACEGQKQVTRWDQTSASWGEGIVSWLQSWNSNEGTWVPGDSAPRMTVGEDQQQFTQLTDQPPCCKIHKQYWNKKQFGHASQQSSKPGTTVLVRVNSNLLGWADCMSEQLHNSESWDSKIWSWFPWDSELRMTVLARASSTCHKAARRQVHSCRIMV